MQGITVTLEELLALRHLAEQIYLPQPRLARSNEFGNYQSPFRGRGMDFVENRAYEPGDDIRSINWAVTARTGKTHTKVYQQERERPVYIIVDFNETMFFGTRTAYKSVTAVHVAALIAWVGLKHRDRIGSVLVKEAIQMLSPCHTKQNLMQTFKNLVKHATPTSQSNVGLAQAMKKLKRTIKSGSLIFVLSDFYNWDNGLENELKHLSRQHDVTNILIYDPIEKTAPEKGRYLFHQFQQQGSLLLDTNTKYVCDRYETIFKDRVERIKKLSYTYGMQLIELATNDNMVQVIRQVLQRKLSS